MCSRLLALYLFEQRKQRPHGPEPTTPSAITFVPHPSAASQFSSDSNPGVHSASIYHKPFSVFPPGFPQGSPRVQVNCKGLAKIRRLLALVHDRTGVDVYLLPANSNVHYGCVATTI